MIPKWLFSFAIVGFYYSVRQTKADTQKIWIANTNFDNPDHWRGNGPACSGDTIYFPAASPVIVFMPEVLAVAEMVLPMNGELVFPRNAVLNITGKTTTANCQGERFEYITLVDYWYDPRNWNITSDLALPLFPSRHNRAVPDAYRVPCRTDRVIFPERTTFSVSDFYPPVSIASLSINGHEYTQETFDRLMSTSTGKMLFRGNPRIGITNLRCTDPAGCVCGNEESSIFNSICKLRKPGKLSCQDPIHVTGHCHPICGAKITAKFNERFTMESFMELPRHLHDHPGFESVESFTSRVSENEVQIVIMDNTRANVFAGTFADLMRSVLRNEINAQHSKYGLTSVTLQKSKIYSGGPPKKDEQTSFNGMSSGGVAGLVISIIIVLGLGMAFYIYKKRQIEGFSFARFDLRSDKIELELGTTPHDELEPEETPIASSTEDKGFDNPVYGTSVTSEGSSYAEESSEVGDYVENPMFKIFEDSSKIEDVQ